MPLITICGHPSSGKTTVAKSLVDALNQHSSQLAALTASPGQTPVIYHVQDEQVYALSRSTTYKDSTDEKKLRGAVLAAVERHLSKNNIVIVDALNYIKGFRYQLYCVARALGTPSCTVHVGVPQTVSMEWNQNKLSQDAESGYPTEILEELITRFEEPNAAARWDAPLFTMVPSAGDTVELILQPLINTITASGPKPNLSTVVKPLTSSNYVSDVDALLTALCNSILALSKDRGQGTHKILNDAHTAIPSGLEITLPRVTTMSELRRLRREYLSVNKLNTMTKMDVLARAFVDFVAVRLRGSS